MAFTYKLGKDNSIIVKDPIYGEIIVPYPFSKIVLTSEMLRLSDISQNGFSHLHYKELENNDRLSHSVGAFYVMSLFLKRLEEILKDYNIELSKDDKDIALCSMLLHDIGHGPYSHTLELVTNYSHEKRTTEILLGNTEINKTITSLFGKDKVRTIASFIAEINDSQELGKDSFTKLLKNLVSHQLDADRIDYLKRDAYYAGIDININLNKIISSLKVIVNNNQEYELAIDIKGLASIENVLLQRYQMYRDVYLSAISVLGDYLFEKIIERYRNTPKLNTTPVSPSFKKLATDPRISNLSDFLAMKDKDFKESFNILSASNVDSILSYLCDFNNVKDYILMEKGITSEQIKTKLKGIFGNIDLDRALSVVSIDAKTKLYKEEQRLYIQDGNRISDLTECTALIRPQAVLNHTYVFFNPELLRLELGLSPIEFQKYREEVEKMVEELNSEPVEFELKYIIRKDIAETLDPISFLEQVKKKFEFFTTLKVDSEIEKENNDEYFDTKDHHLYKNKGSLRIRKTSQKGKRKIKGTFKKPFGEGTVYSSRSEIEEDLPEDSFTTFRQIMTNSNASVDFANISELPVLNSYTNRKIISFKKKGVTVEFSFDITKYTNHELYDISAIDRMIEIEAKGGPNNRVILNEIHDFIAATFEYLEITKQSKYERGINLTLDLYNYMMMQSREIPSLAFSEGATLKPDDFVLKIDKPDYNN